MKQVIFINILLALAAHGLQAQSYVPEFANTAVKIKPAIPIRAMPFSLKDVRLLDGPFKEAMEADARYLLTIEPDRSVIGVQVACGNTAARAKIRRMGILGSGGSYPGPLPLGLFDAICLHR